MVCVLGTLLAFVPKPLAKQANLFPNNANVTICCRQTSLPCTEIGNGKLVQCSLANVHKTLAACQNVDGLSIRFFGTLDDFNALQASLNLQVSSVQQLQNLTIVCGYSNKICGSIMVEGNRVNVQMAFDGQTITVGSPLILDSY